MLGQQHTDHEHRNPIDDPRSDLVGLGGQVIADQFVGAQQNDDKAGPPHPEPGNGQTSHNERDMKRVLDPSGANLSGQQQVGRRRNDCQGHNDRGRQGEGLGEGQGLEELTLGPGHGEDRQEADHGRGNGRQDRAADFRRTAVDHLQTVLIRSGGVEVLENVLRHDNSHVHNSADGDGDAGQGDDVGVHAEHLHGDEADQHRQRQGGTDQQRTPQVHQHDDNDDDRDQHFLFKSSVECSQRLVDQAGTIIEGHNSHLAGGHP